MTVQIDRKLVKSLRLSKSYSQEKLAEVAGVNTRTIQRIEKDGLASLQSRAALARAFGVNPDDLDAAEESMAQELANIQRLPLFPLGITITTILFAIGVAFESQVGAIYALTGTIGIGTRGIVGLVLIIVSFVLLARRIDLPRWRPYFLFAAVSIGLLTAPWTWSAQLLVALPVWAILELSIYCNRAVRRGRANGSSSLQNG